MVSSKNAEVYRRVVAREFNKGIDDNYSEFSSEPETI